MEEDLDVVADVVSEPVVERLYTVFVKDPIRENRETMIVVKTNENEIGYHSRLARYLKAQSNRLIPHFYDQWEAKSRSDLQAILTRMRQTISPEEKPALQEVMKRPFSALIASAHLDKIQVNGTHVCAVFAYEGISTPLETFEMMIPFTNLQISRDIDAMTSEPSPM